MFWYSYSNVFSNLYSYLSFRRAGQREHLLLLQSMWNFHHFIINLIWDVCNTNQWWNRRPYAAKQDLMFPYEWKNYDTSYIWLAMNKKRMQYHLQASGSWNRPSDPINSGNQVYKDAKTNLNHPKTNLHIPPGLSYRGSRDARRAEWQLFQSRTCLKMSHEPEFC